MVHVLTPVAESSDGSFFEIAPLGDFEIDRPTPVEIDGRRITIVRTTAGVFAFGSSCPHMGAPMCHGSVHGTMLPSNPDEYVYGEDGQVIRCPWHGYEFSLRTGQSIAGAFHGRVPIFELEVRDDVVFASLIRAKR